MSAYSQIQPSPAAVFLAAHPVGSLYTTSRTDEDTTTKMAGRYGGTWSKLSEGTFIRAAGTTAGGTGGEAAHKLTLAEIGISSHQVERAASYGEWTANVPDMTKITAHNTLPPYRNYYVYERLT
jgi:hypothetical protein